MRLFNKFCCCFKSTSDEVSEISAPTATKRLGSNDVSTLSSFSDLKVPHNLSKELDRRSDEARNRSQLLSSSPFSTNNEENDGENKKDETVGSKRRREMMINIAKRN